MVYVAETTDNILKDFNGDKCADVLIFFQTIFSTNAPNLILIKKQRCNRKQHNGNPLDLPCFSKYNLQVKCKLPPEHW